MRTMLLCRFHPCQQDPRNFHLLGIIRGWWARASVFRFFYIFRDSFRYLLPSGLPPVCMLGEVAQAWRAAGLDVGVAKSPLQCSPCSTREVA